MKQPVCLLVTVIFNSLCFSKSAGKPQQDTDLANDDGDRSAYPFALIGSKLSLGTIPSHPDFGPASVPTGSLSPVRSVSECYACTDCPQILPNTTVRQCGHNAAKCVVYSEKYNHLSNPIYIRGCASERGTCDDVKKAHEGHQNVVQLLSCEDCFGDKCNTNGVPKSLPDLTTAMFFIVVCPLITKYTLS